MRGIDGTFEGACKVQSAGVSFLRRGRAFLKQPETSETTETSETAETSETSETTETLGRCRMLGGPEPPDLYGNATEQATTLFIRAFAPSLTCS